MFHLTLHNTHDPRGFDRIRRVAFDRPISMFAQFAANQLNLNSVLQHYSYDTAILWAGTTPYQSFRKTEPDTVHA